MPTLIYQFTYAFYLFVTAYLCRPICLVLDGSYPFIYDVHNYCVYILGSLEQIHMQAHIIFVLFELVKQYLAPQTSKIIQALLQRYPWRLWEVVDCLAQDVTRCGSLPLIRNTSRSQTSSTWLLATWQIYVGLQHSDLEWYDQVYWDGCNRGICWRYDKMIQDLSIFRCMYYYIWFKCCSLHV